MKKEINTDNYLSPSRQILHENKKLLGKGYNKYIHDFRPNWSCSNCGNKWTKPAGDYPAGKWWMCCTNCEKGM